MTRARWLLALPALMIATSGVTLASEVRDKAGMFGAEAVRKAEAELNRIEREYQVPVTIETVESLDGKTINQVLTEHAKAVRARGIYTLIARRDKKIQIEPERAYERFITTSRMHAVRDAFNGQFAKGDFDAGLLDGVSKLDATLAEARAEAGGSLKPATPPARRAAEAPVAAGRPAARTTNWGIGSMSLIGIVLMIFAALLVFRIIGGLFSAARGGGGYGGGPGGPGRMGGPGGYGGGGPGYGAPGYGGGGGGGFMSSLFGGIGGAMAGNWLYDRMSGGHHGGGYTDQTSYDPGQAAVPDQAAGPVWDQPADEGASWGATGGDAGAGGGDWGGGGGGDWGGGGGGDWGGGGGDAGGDWGGGGNDNGGGW